MIWVSRRLSPLRGSDRTETQTTCTVSQGKGQQGTGSKAGGYHDLKVYGPDDEVAVPMVPKRALELAQQLTGPAVTAIKTNQWGEGWPG